MAYKSKGPSMRQGGTFMSKHNSSYMHKQNLLNDMPVDDHAGSPMHQKEEEGEGLLHSPDRKNKSGQTQLEVYNKAYEEFKKHKKAYEGGTGTRNAAVDALNNVTRVHDSIDNANQKMDKHLQDVINKMNKGNYPGSLQK